MQDSYLSRSQKRSSTPTQRQKYDNYTPRKRYIKEQQEFSQYFQNQQRLSLPCSPQFQVSSHRPYRSHITSSANKKREVLQPKPLEKEYSNEYNQLQYDFSSPLNECTFSLNARPSLKKQKYSMCTEDNKNLSRYLNFQGEKTNSSNYKRVNRQKVQVEQQPLTPRKAYKKDEDSGILTQKMIALQQKITRLQKMNPKRSNTPKKSRVIEQTKWQLQLEKQEKDTSVSSRVISQKENELMSRVSLGRLVQQQQHENEIDVIQDLSYKISSKLQTIIRNFG